MTFIKILVPVNGGFLFSVIKNALRYSPLIFLTVAQLVADSWWSCRVYVPVSQLIYAAFRSNAKRLFPPRDECRRRGL